MIAQVAVDEGPETASGRMPDFFIVGHERCGTTALYEMLRSHPQIYMPDLKEPRFFARDLERVGGQSGLFPRTLDRYLALFGSASPEQRVGEGSPQYLSSPVAAARIAQAQPAARIIAILREPVSFLRSLHLLRVKGELETEQDLRSAIAMEELRRGGECMPDVPVPPGWLLYSDYVRYVEQIDRFLAVFPPEQILVLIYDDFRRDNEATLRRVLRFLEVDDSVAPPAINAAPLEKRKAVRSVRLNRLTRRLLIARHRPDSVGPLTRRVSSLAPRRLMPLWRRIIYKRAEPADEALVLELRRRFKPEVVALSDFLKRDLVSEWGYRDIG